MLMCLAAPAFAQGDRGAITGQITDATGAVVPNVQVTATELATHTVFKAVTTSVGVYRIPYLPAGDYRVSAVVKGFKTAVVEPVVVAVATVVTADLKLELGATTESVTVSANATQLESSSSELGYNVSAEDYHDWPINSDNDGQRQINSFVFNSLPGTDESSAGGGYGSINGSPTGSHEVYIEGISIGRADVSGAISEFQPSVDAISEFRLQTGGLNAAYGGGLTAVANFNVKSGTNQLHGTAYEYLINDDLNANGFDNNAYGNPKAPYKQNSFGTAVGGPILLPKIYNGKNRSFWFFSYEGTRRREGNLSCCRTVATPAFKKGDFSAVEPIFDPASTAEQPDGTYTRTAFPGNIIPTSDFSKVSANILTLAPTPDPTLPGVRRNIPSLPGSPIFNLDSYTGKFDQTITDKQKLSFYWSDNNRVRYNGSGGGYLPAPGNASSTYNLQSVYGTMIRLGYDWTITPNILNHFAAGYNNFDNDHHSLSTGQNWPSKLGLTGVEETTFPGINFNPGNNIPAAQGGSMTPLGNNSTGDSPNGSYIFSDETTWIHGSHAIKWGAEVRKYYYVEPQNWGSSGQFYFGPNTTADPNNLGTTGYSYASFLLGAVNSSSMPVEYVDITTTDTWNPAFYVTDDWKVNRRLTINFGLRWEIAGAETEQKGVSSTLGPSTPNPGAGGYPGALVFLKPGQSSFQNWYYGEVGPRLGFAYQISKSLVLRGGYGLMYTPPIGNAFGEATVDGFVGQNNFAPTTFNPVFNWDNGYPAYPATLPNKDPSQDNGNTISYTAPNSARQPYAQNYTLSLQYLLKEKTIIQASYVGNIGSRLNAGNFSNMNQLNPKYLSLGDTLLQNCSTTSLTTCVPGVPLPYSGFSATNPNPIVAQALLPYPQFAGGGSPGIPTGGGVFYHFPYFGHSNYNALQVVATRRMSKGLAFLISYSFQKTLTNTDSASVYTGASGYAQDVYNRALEKSVAAFDHPQNLKLTWIYELPFGKGHPFLNKSGIVNQVLGGWTITGNQIYQSGDPLSISAGISASSYLFDGNVRANIVSGQSLSAPHTGSLQVANSGPGVTWLNPNAFAAPPMSPNGVVLSLGNSPRYFGTLRGPFQPSENFGIFKRFHFGETRFLEIRCDAFNAFNRTGLADPDTTVGDQYFGQSIDVQQGPREVQVAARITF
jgi:hypothetical protein